MGEDSLQGGSFFIPISTAMMKQVDTSDEAVIMKKERIVKKSVESITLTKSRVILSSTSQWSCGCLVKKQDRSYWLDDVSKIALDTSPFKKFWFYLGLLFLVAFIVLMIMAEDVCSNASASNDGTHVRANAAATCKKPMHEAGYVCLALGLLFWIVCYIKYRCSMATIYFTVRAGADLGSWMGMPSGAASSTTSESFDLTLFPAREFHKAFLSEVTKTKKTQ